MIDSKQTLGEKKKPGWGLFTALILITPIIFGILYSYYLLSSSNNNPVEKFILTFFAGILTFIVFFIIGLLISLVYHLIKRSLNKNNLINFFMTATYITMVICGLLLFGLKKSGSDDSINKYQTENTVWSTQEKFQAYTFPNEGVVISLPSKPSNKRFLRIEGGYTNQYQSVLVNPPSTYSLFIGHSARAILDKSVAKIYLNETIRGLASASKAKITRLERKHFQKYPAIKYAMNGSMEGRKVVYRGIAFVADGQYMRLSQIALTNDKNANKRYQTLINSFRLTAIRPTLSKKRYVNVGHNISIKPPANWKYKLSSRYPKHIAGKFVHRSGHALILMSDSSGNPKSGCDNYGVGLKSVQKILELSKARWNGRPVTYIKATAFNKIAGIEMTGAHYCFTLKDRIVVIMGGSPAKTFFRAEAIFEAVAKTYKKAR